MIDKFLKSLKEKGWKQTKIAKMTDLEPHFISKLAHGANCSLETVIKIADAFGVTVDEVLGRSPARTLAPEEEMILQTTAGDRDIARVALRSAEGEKLIKEVKGEGRGRGKAA